MKKIISICMLCLFIALGSKAANTMSVLKNTGIKKITIKKLFYVYCRFIESILRMRKKTHLQYFLFNYNMLGFIAIGLSSPFFLLLLIVQQNVSF